MKDKHTNHSSYLKLSIIVLSMMLTLELSQNAFASRTTGIMIPLYTYPGSTWDQVIAAKTAHPSVPIVAIINPSNGSGNRQDQAYVTGIQNLQSSGITVLGYVHTNYAARNIALAVNDTNNYKNWYGVNGVFFDEMSSNAGNESYYRYLDDYAKSLGMTLTVGNSGVDVAPSYVGVVDNIVIHDNLGTPSISNLGGWHIGYDKSNFSLLSYGVTTLDPTFVMRASNYAGYIYITNGTLPNPWNFVTPYLESTLDLIKSDIAVSVKSIQLANSTIPGIWTEIYSGNMLVKTGFTPNQYWVVPDLEYTICTSDFADHLFAHWDDGSSVRCRVITPIQNYNATSYYRTHSTLTVESTKAGGEPLTGMWTEIYSGNIQVESGFTPNPYSLLTFLPYRVCVADFQNNTFSHWENGNTARCRTLELDNYNLTISAQYN